MNIKSQLSEILNTKELITALSNTTALLFDYYKDLNWLGFYLYKDDHLILGPFQGKVACECIEIGKGVCGASIKLKEVLNIPDVHKFEGHIACDSASNSEIVLPLFDDNNIYGVLDIDSFLFDRFSKDDEKELIELSKLIIERIKKDYTIFL